jgi:hypothetical protein
MQSFITRGVGNKYYLYVILTKNKIRHINIVQEMEYTLNNENIENTVILEKCRKIIKFFQKGLVPRIKVLVVM